MKGNGKMNIKKNDIVRISTPSIDEWTPARSECAIVTTIFKTGNIKVVNISGTGSTLDSNFFKTGGTMEKVIVGALEIQVLFSEYLEAVSAHDAPAIFKLRKELAALDPTQK